jgi:hypothetical protein
MFCVESQEEREEWIAAIQLVSDELKNSDEGAEGPYTNPHKTKVNSCAPSVAPVMLPAENPVISKKKKGGCNIVKIKHTKNTKNITTFFFDLSNIGGPSAPILAIVTSSHFSCHTVFC